MAVVLSVPSAVYAPNTYTVGPANVPLGVTQMRATLTRESWPLTNSDVVVIVRIEVSYNNGADGFPEFVETEWRGGDLTNWRGPVTQEVVQRNVQQPANPNRRIRAKVTVLAQLRTAVVVEAF